MSTLTNLSAMVLDPLIGDRALKPNSLVMEIHEVTLAAGASDTVVCKNINNVRACFFSFKTAQANDIWATAGGVYWSASAGTITLTPANNFEAEAAVVLVIGSYNSTTAPSL